MLRGEKRLEKLSIPSFNQTEIRIVDNFDAREMFDRL